MPEAGQAFQLHYSKSVADEPFTLKITVPADQLDDPFDKVVFNPFLEALNATLPFSERVSVEELERIVAGPGDRTSDPVMDLSATVRSIITACCSIFAIFACC